MMKILFETTAIAAILILLMFMVGCGSTVPDRLVGQWDCANTSSGVPVDTSFYTMDIETDGTFSLDNENTGKSDISGTMEGDDTGKLGILDLTCDKSGFKPPKCWPNLKTTSSVRYKIIDKNTIKLGYVGIWMTFNK